MLRSAAIKVVLDTSVIVSGLMAKKQGKDTAALSILHWLEARLFLLECNGNIMSEYQRVLDEKAQSHDVEGRDVGWLLSMVRKEGCFDHILVRPPIFVSHDPSDNIYFDSLNCIFANFLVTSNTRHFNDEIRKDLVALKSGIVLCKPNEFTDSIRKIRNKN